MCKQYKTCMDTEYDSPRMRLNFFGRPYFYPVWDSPMRSIAIRLNTSQWTQKNKCNERRKMSTNRINVSYFPFWSHLGISWKLVPVKEWHCTMYVNTMRFNTDGRINKDRNDEVGRKGVWRSGRPGKEWAKDLGIKKGGKWRWEKRRGEGGEVKWEGAGGGRRREINQHHGKRGKGIFAL